MPTNIVESLLSSAKDLTGPLANYLGASEGSVKSAMGAAVPALLAGLMQKAATPQGASDLFQWITAPAIDTGIPPIADAVANPDRAGSLVSLGSSLLGKLFGDKTTQLADAIGATAGLKPAAASSLMAMAAPLLLGFLKKQVTANGLSISGLSDLLLDQKGFLEKMGLDSRITRALGFSSLSSLLDGVSSMPAAAMQGVRAAAAGTAAAGAAVATAGSSNFRRALPWLVAALLAALVYFGLMRSRPVHTPADGSPVVATPQSGYSGAGLRVSVYFDTGQAALGADSQTTIATTADRIKQNGMRINITGYTDPTGDPTKNAELAKERAKAVRSALLAAGVADASITLQPPASITGSGSDLEARRVEIAQAP
jgi:outer membrane protein OmpA-like peptidoglycan-associated protein